MVRKRPLGFLRSITELGLIIIYGLHISTLLVLFTWPLWILAWFVFK